MAPRRSPPPHHAGRDAARRTGSVLGGRQTGVEQGRAVIHGTGEDGYGIRIIAVGQAFGLGVGVRHRRHRGHVDGSERGVSGRRRDIARRCLELAVSIRIRVLQRHAPGAVLFDPFRADVIGARGRAAGVIDQPHPRPIAYEYRHQRYQHHRGHHGNRHLARQSRCGRTGMSTRIGHDSSQSYRCDRGHATTQYSTMTTPMHHSQALRQTLD